MCALLRYYDVTTPSMTSLRWEKNGRRGFTSDVQLRNVVLDNTYYQLFYHLEIFPNNFFVLNITVACLRYFIITDLIFRSPYLFSSDIPVPRYQYLYAIVPSYPRTLVPSAYPGSYYRWSRRRRGGCWMTSLTLTVLEVSRVLV